MNLLKNTVKSTANQPPSLKSILAQLFSPAMGLAILGTIALIFSFYRARQLSTLVIPKNEIPQVKKDVTPIYYQPKF